MSSHAPSIGPTIPAQSAAKTLRRLRRLLGLAVAATLVGALVIAADVPHRVARGVVHLRAWLEGADPLVVVFVGLMGLLVIASAVAADERAAQAEREIFDVR